MLTKKAAGAGWNRTSIRSNPVPGQAAESERSRPQLFCVTGWGCGEKRRRKERMRGRETQGERVTLQEDQERWVDLLQVTREEGDGNFSRWNRMNYYLKTKCVHIVETLENTKHLKKTPFI